MPDMTQKNSIELNRAALETSSDVAISEGRFEQARDLLKELLEDESLNLPDIARLQRKMGNAYASQWAFEESLYSYEQAFKTLQQLPENNEWWQEWIELQLDYSFPLHTTNRFDELVRLIQEIKPVIESKGSNQQKIKYLKLVFMDFLRRYRWFMCPEETISHIRMIIQLAKTEKDHPTEIWAWGLLGFTHFWRNEIKLARDACEAAFELMKHTAYDEVTAMCNTTFAFSYRREKKAEQAEVWARKAIAHAARNNNQTYEKFNETVLAWVYLKQKNFTEAERCAISAYDFFTSIKLPHLPVCGLLLIHLFLLKNKIAEAAQYAFVLLHPETQRMPEDITLLVKEAVAFWGEGDLENTRQCLCKAVELADETGYL